MKEEKVISLVKNNYLLVLVIIYFGRFAIPQGTYFFSLTFLFYYLTIYIAVGGLVLLGLFAIIGLIRSIPKKAMPTAKHKYFLLIAILGLALYGLSFITRYVYENKKFDSVTWINTDVSLDVDSNLITLRHRMTNDLTQNILSGLTQNDAETLLGSPTYSWQREEGGLTMDYLLGPHRHILMEYECLYIYFDESGLFQSYTIATCG